MKSTNLRRMAWFLGASFLVTAARPEGARAQSVSCDKLLTDCSALVTDLKAQRDARDVRIVALSNQINQLKNGHGFNGLTDRQAMDVASAALSLLEQKQATEASAQDLEDASTQLRALQARTSKLTEKTKALAAQRRAAENAR